jgi:hypothetical protein
MESMLKRIWIATLILSSSCFISPVIGIFTVNTNSSFVDKATAYSPPSPRKNKKAVIVSKAEFGVVRIDSKGKVTLIPTTRVPYEEGKRYGWRIHLKEYQGTLTWQEILKLPKVPETWGTENGETFSVSPSGKEGVTKRTELIQNGVIENFWTIAPGDPIGKHKIDINVGDRSIASFEFEVTSLKK